MKLIQYTDNQKLAIGILDHQQVISLNALLNDDSAPATMEQLIAKQAHFLPLISAALQKLPADLPTKSINELNLEPVVTNPEKIMAIGLNYAAHAAEADRDRPASPVVFGKSVNTLSAANEALTLPKMAGQFDYEAELVIIIGEEGYQLSEDEARKHIFGYTLGNDISARDIQFRTDQWYLGKTLERLTPIGPAITTADEFKFDGASIKGYVNDVVVQNSNLDLMLFKPAKLVSYISQYVPVRPGDIIMTGTPNGVQLGKPENEKAWLKDGDKLTVEIDGLGRLTNTVFDEK